MTLQFQSYPFKKRLYFVWANICWFRQALGQQESAPFIVLHKLLWCLPSVFSARSEQTSSCKIDIFHYRVTQSAEPESILFLLGLKCGFPQIFQELATAKGGHCFVLPWKPSMLPARLVCTAVFLWCIQLAVTTYHLSFLSQFHLKMDVNFLRHI